MVEKLELQLKLMDSGKDINKARNFIERNKSKIKMISFEL